MKKISKDVFLMNIFLGISFILIYFLLTFYISHNLKMEQIKEMENLRHFVLNEKNELEKNISYKNYHIEELKEDIYTDLKGNTDVYINFRYEGNIVIQDKKFIKEFNLQKNKLIREENIYILNIPLFIKNINKSIDVQILYDVTKDINMLTKIKVIAFIFLSILFILSIMITTRFYFNLKKQIDILKKATDDIDLNNIKLEIKDDDFYSEFSNVIAAYKIMLKKIKNQTESETEFVNSASHELKTPIFIISGYAQLLEKTGNKNMEIFNEALSVIKEKSKEMAVLTEKLLFLARKDYNEVSYEVIDIKEILELIIEEMKIVYPESKFKIIGCNFKIESDNKLIKQLFRNIIENGVKYGKGSLIELFLSENNLTKENKVVINDSGIGMDEEELRNVFNKFYRADKSRNKFPRGHGLGLSIVKTIAELLNIKIEIKSKKNRGTSVAVILKKDRIEGN